LFRTRRLPSAVLVAVLLASCPLPGEAGIFSSITKFCSSVGNAVVGVLDGAADIVKETGSLVANGLLTPINFVCGTDMSVSFTDPKTGKKSPKQKVSPELLKTLQTNHLISTSCEIAGKKFGDEKTIHFKVDQPGEVTCRIAWTGAPRLAMILNGPGQVGYYDRVDGPSSLYFKFVVTEALVKKGKEWRITVKDFSKSNTPSKVTLTAFTPRTMGETLDSATTEQRAGFAEQDIRKLAARVADLENQLRLEKEFTRRLHDLIKQLRDRINAVDHKDDGKNRG